MLCAASREFGHPRLDRRESGESFGQDVEADGAQFFPGTPARALFAHFDAHFLDHARRVIVNPDADPLLNALGVRGIRRAVVTNTATARARATIRGVALEPDEIIGASDALEKPDPARLRLACERPAVQGECALRVGASSFDRGAAGGASSQLLFSGCCDDPLNPSCVPWSLWITVVPSRGLRCSIAIPRAFVTSAAVGCPSIDQPTTRRLKASSTTAQYTFPSRVACRFQRPSWFWKAVPMRVQKPCSPCPPRARPSDDQRPLVRRDSQPSPALRAIRVVLGVDHVLQHLLDLALRVDQQVVGIGDIQHDEGKPRGDRKLVPAGRPADLRRPLRTVRVDNLRTESTSRPIAQGARSRPARKEERIDVRLDREAKITITRAAALWHQSVSDFILSATLERCQEVIERANVIRLNEQESERLLAALENPPAPSPKLRKAAEKYQKALAKGRLEVR